jgi:hypothetical protein
MAKHRITVTSHNSNDPLWCVWTRAQDGPLDVLFRCAGCDGYRRAPPVCTRGTAVSMDSAGSARRVDGIDSTRARRVEPLQPPLQRAAKEALGVDRGAIRTPLERRAPHSTTMTLGATKPAQDPAPLRWTPRVTLAAMPAAPAAAGQGPSGRAQRNHGLAAEDRRLQGAASPPKAKPLTRADSSRGAWDAGATAPTARPQRAGRARGRPPGQSGTRRQEERFSSRLRSSRPTTTST